MQTDFNMLIITIIGFIFLSVIGISVAYFVEREEKHRKFQTEQQQIHEKTSGVIQTTGRYEKRAKNAYFAK